MRRPLLKTVVSSEVGKLSGSTKLAAVIGDPVQHSLSPALFNGAFDAMGMDWVYLAFTVEADGAAQAVKSMRALGIRGMSVTMPHKVDVIAALDSLSPTAELLNAVNCIVNNDGHLRGYNTDGAGFLGSLIAQGFDPADKTCLVVGAGGAARAVILALAEAGASEVIVHNRDLGRATVAAALGAGAGSVGSSGHLEGDLAKCDLAINCTPLGMQPDDEPPMPFRAIRKDQFVADLIYHPAQTPLLEAAQNVGAEHCNGVGMLTHQAAEAFTLITGIDAPLKPMESAMRAALEGRSANKLPE